MSEITRGAIGMPFEMAMESELSRRQFHSIAQALLVERDQLKAENERLESEAVYAAAGFDAAREEVARLKAENEALRKDADRFRRMRAMTLAQIEDTQDEFDAEFDRQLDAAMGKGGQS